MMFQYDELDEFLVEKLSLIRQTTPRDPKIAWQRRNQYMKKANNLQHSKPRYWFANLLDRKLGPALSIPRRSWVPLAAGVLIILGLAFGGWGTVYAAQNSQPDDLLYPVKLVVDYLEDLTSVSADLDQDDGVHRILRSRDQDSALEPRGNDAAPGEVESPYRNKNQYQYGLADEVVTEPMASEDPITPIEEIGPPPDVISGTQTISRTQDGYLWGWGPGPCEMEEPGDCDPFGPYGNTYTYTHGLDAETPPKFEGDLEQPVPDPNPPAVEGNGPGPDQEANPPQSPDPNPDANQPENPPVKVQDGGENSGSDDGGDSNDRPDSGDGGAGGENSETGSAGEDGQGGKP